MQYIIYGASVVPANGLAAVSERAKQWQNSRRDDADSRLSDFILALSLSLFVAQYGVSFTRKLLGVVCLLGFYVCLGGLTTATIDEASASRRRLFTEHAIEIIDPVNKIA